MRTTGDTMAEGLRKMLAQVAGLGTLPDADLQFLSKLQTVITAYLRQGASTGGGEMQLPQQSAGPPPGVGPPPMGPGGPMPPGGPMMGLTPSASAPNMDELRRTLGSSERAT